MELPNKAGALADFAAKLAKNGVNIDAACGTVPKGARKSDLKLITSEPWFGMARISTRAKWCSLRSARGSMLKKYLTQPAL